LIDLNDVRPLGLTNAQARPPIGEVAQRLNERAAELARALLGEPNRSLSTRTQLRFGNKGSIAVEIDGTERGRWYDHENGVGGDGISLVSQTLDLANGAACEWAIDWLGLGDRADPIRTDGAGRTDRRESTAPADDKASKVVEIVAGCKDPRGTCVETYLAARGITARPLPPCIRYRPDAYSRYGALVALSTDAAGAVHAVQQIYLTSDGRKAPIKVQKRTNKARDDWSDLAAVRLPGTTPIVLTEGVETALSVWQATGYETWACLGISNIARAPVPEGVAVVVARDGDEAGSKADNQIRRAVTILRGQGLEVTVAEPPPGKDFNDVLMDEGEEAVRARLQAPVSADLYSTSWRSGLLYNDEGEPRPILANAIHALRHAPEWDGVLWHNEFATTTVARKPPPWAAGVRGWKDMSWSDRDDYLVAEWLQRQGIMAPASVAGQAVETIARDRVFHPVREYLDSLAWDGTARLDGWLMTYLGVVDTPYACAVGARWLLSAVARIYVPGAKADCVLILEGPQGIKKSSALMTLAEPWFTDRISDLGSKDAAMETKGVWIIEVAELDSMSRTEVGAIKAFISRSHDRFRPPYGKRLVDLPRQCVFAGSVNPEGGYLKDATGGRRFWPVLCTTIDVARLRADRDQLWAEARHRFRAGEPWWLESRELNAVATEEQDDRYQGDAWEDPIREYLESEVQWSENGYGERKPHYVPRPEPLNDTSVAEVLEHALRIERGRWSQVDQNRVVRCLVSMGFKRRKVRRNGQREWRYLRDPNTRDACGPTGPTS
jgi:predicted P-loop ATPase